ncbi:hypothetical protein TNCV_4042891 [Trichonephila clavipes]|nr:hypothetical protein TNCV_4042891 [Trichonephila clavipes]
MKKFDQTPYKLPPPTPIHVRAEKRPLEENSLPFSKKRSKVRITPVMRHSTTTCEDSRCPTACADSRCPRTCADSTCRRTTYADSSVTSLTVTCADSTYAVSTCAYSRCSRTCADSSVTSPTATYADSPRTYADSTCIRTCADSSVESPTVTCANSSAQVPQSPVQIPVSQVPEPPMQLLPELDTLDRLESTDAFDQLMSFVFGPQELQLLHTVPSIFDGNLFSFVDEFERAPMNLTMPRLNSCVKKNLSNLNPSNPWICLSIVGCSSLYIFFVRLDLCKKIYRSHPTHGSVCQ